MTTVLHLINYLGNGGSEKYILLLAEKLHDKSCRFYAAYSEEGSGRKSFEDAHIDLLKLNMTAGETCWFSLVPFVPTVETSTARF